MTIEIDSIELPDLVMEGQFGWSGVRASVDRSPSGAPIVWEGETAGRPIDLVGTVEAAWISRATLKSLRDLAGVPGATYTLTFGSETFMVRFRHEDAPVIEATPVMPTPETEDEDRYNQVRIKLMEIS